MFTRKEEPVFTISWTQENRNGEMQPKEWKIRRNKSTIYDVFYNLSKENVIELRDLLNKQCLD